MSKNLVVLYSTSYPFGNEETFLHNEVKYLADQVDKIVIIPFKKKSERSRSLPSNVEVLEPIFTTLSSFGVRELFASLPDIFKEIAIGKKFNKLVLKNIIVTSIARYRFKKRSIQSLIDNIVPHANITHYFYWGFGLSSCVEYLKTSNPTSRVIVRFHGFDLYKERSGGYLPYQRELVKYADRLVFISNHGMGYFKSQFPASSPKLRCYYLGVDGPNSPVNRNISQNEISVYSCSNVIPLKRVSLIYDTLILLAKRNPSMNFRWNHFGDGTEFGALKQAVAGSKTIPNLSVSLHGRVNYDYISSHYSSGDKSIFLNLSTSEGLPVSIMEAASYNIPVVATDVGGTSEMLSATVGITVAVDSDIEHICAMIEVVLKNYSSYNPWDKWVVNYSAHNNYAKFIESEIMK